MLDKMNKIIYLLIILLSFGCKPTKKGELNNGKSEVEEIRGQSTLTQELSEKDTNILIKELPCDSTKCNLDAVLAVFHHKDDLSDSIVAALLKTFDVCCNNNVEFGEFSNEMLFVILQKRPDLFFKQYENLIDEIDTAYINFELQNPIHDLIPLKEILRNVDTLECDRAIKNSIIKNLRKGGWD